MSAVAAYCRSEGIAVGGSDRLVDSPDVQDVKCKLVGAGCRLFQQDGSGASCETQAVVISTAIEEDNPDIRWARKRLLPIFHRSDVLAAIVRAKKSVVIAGTSGKSTVTAMTYELLTKCGKSPSLIAGANLKCLEDEGVLGNFFHGQSDLLIVEGDESDGTIVKYKPDLSVFLNVSKDHKPVLEVRRLFAVLADQSKSIIVNADDLGLFLPKATVTFGTSMSAQYRPDVVEAVAPEVVFMRNKVRFHLPQPGRHNLSNALAALCVCNFLGCDDEELAAALPGVKGVKRRFSCVTLPNGIAVIDDFAHNPEKIKAAITTAKMLSPRVLAIFQPHGFGPTRFLKDDFVALFSTIFREEDALFLLPIYYAGGTANKDITSNEIADLVRKVRPQVFAPADRPECLAMIKSQASPGDAVLLMGARDPSLSFFAKQIAEALEP
jgi:UDP-N-acetylmuramate--alanine ligase